MRPSTLIELMRRAGLADEVLETHISYVLLAADRAYKLKKPLVLPFVDYGTAERRRRCCEEEVRLNRRLAPSVYLGVRALVVDDDRIQLAEAGAQGAVDHVVEMRRLETGATLAERLRAGKATADDLRAVGARLARFHADAERVEPQAVRADIKRAYDETFETILTSRSQLEPAVAAPARFCDAFLVARADEIDARAAAGLVRDGHGDLRAEHVVLADGSDVEIFDCVEFDRRFGPWT